MSNRHPSASSFATLVDLLRARAGELPDREAYRFLLDGFLLDGEEASVSWTFADLDRHARAVAGHLQELGLKPGMRVLLLYPSGLDFIAAFFGCLYSGLIAVPAYPPTSKRTLPRLMSILQDARPAVVLAPESIRQQAIASLGSQNRLRWVSTDDLFTDGAAQSNWEQPDLDGDSIAFLQYTSGSTAEPKGVEVSHGNLLHNEWMIQQAFEQDADSVIVGWLPLYHDMGLIGNVLQPLYLGARCILMSPLSFLKRPLRWLEAISHFRATTSGAPNFAYELCLRKIRPADRQHLDLSSWTVAYNGAEPVRQSTIERFSQSFAGCGFNRRAFYPCYGLAEATLFVTGGQVAEDPRIEVVDSEALENHRAMPLPGAAPHDLGVQALVGSGRPWSEQKVRIVDPESCRVLGANEVGEIWISGPSVAKGYWRRAEDTAQTFEATTDDGEGPFLRTGDLGFLTSDGELLVTGRQKDLIILRGRNHYPQDFEATAEKTHPALRPGCGAAFSVEIDNEEKLVLVHELDDRSFSGDPNAVISALRSALAEEHQVQVHDILLIASRQLPKTSSGKIQRRLARQLYLKNQFDGIASSPETQTLQSEAVEIASDQAEARALLDLLAQLAKVTPDTIQPEASLYALGLDSLMAVELRQRLLERFGKAPDLAALLAGPSPLELLDLLAGSETSELPTLVAHGEREAPLSSGQSALWFLQRLDPESVAYNIAVAVRLHQPLDAASLRQALESLGQRHEALRTSFSETAEGPRQTVGDAVRLRFDVEEAQDWSEEQIKERLAAFVNQPFDLEHDDLLRVLVLDPHDSASGPILAIVVHHIVADLWSLGLLLGELRQLLDGEDLPASEFSYLDYTRWQRERLASDDGERLWKFWQSELAGELPPLALPTDRPRPARQTFRGATLSADVPTALSDRLKHLAAQHGTTLNAVLTSAFQTLLAIHTQQREVLVGTPAIGRETPEMRRLFGYFVNPLVLRATFDQRLTFLDLLKRNQDRLAAALDHQGFPFPLLVERLQPERDSSRSPLFQAMFVFQSTDFLAPAERAAYVLGRGGVELDFAGRAATSLPPALNMAQFDLELIAAEIDQEGQSGIGLTLLYNSELFDASTAMRWLERFPVLLERVVENPRGRALAYDCRTESERGQMLAEWASSTFFAGPETVVESEIDVFSKLFEEQARRTPKALAITCGSAKKTYAELDQRADEFANGLLGADLQPEARVAILSERSIDLVAVMISIFKVGAVYLPLDPRHPRRRLEQTLARARPTVLLCDAANQGTASELAALPGSDFRVLSLDALGQDGEGANPRVASRSEIDPEQLAYILYTSGSTGQPKGAMLNHGGMLNHLRAKIEDLALVADDVVAQNASQTFDISIWQCLAALMVGGRVCIFPDEIALDPAELLTQTDKQQVTVLEVVPSMLRMMLDLEGASSNGSGSSHTLTALRWLIPTGEALAPELARRWLETHPRVPLVNAYGPTECSDDVSHAILQQPPSQDAIRLPIGRAVRATQLYVLDRSLLPRPRGVVGELFVGGRGVGRGYFADPHRTVEAFIPDPFTARTGQRMYRTGDLVAAGNDGQLVFFGRTDEQVKVRGFRVELKEIEAVLSDHPAVRECVVIARRDASQHTRLIAYWVATADASDEGLRDSLAERLPEYMVPSALVQLERLPLNANGKIDRKALPEPNLEQLSDVGEVVTPRDALEAGVVEIWQVVLGLEAIGVEQNFFSLGGHSLLATQVISRLRRAYDVDLPLRSLFEHPTVASLARAVEEARHHSAAPPSFDAFLESGRSLQPIASFAQERLWFLQKLDPESPAYNMPGVLDWAGEFRGEVFERALDQLSRRHEALRTTFREEHGRPLPVVAEEPIHELRKVDLSTLDPTEREREIARLIDEESRQPFDLATGPLFRVLLARLGDEHHQLVVTLHHIISDGWSQALIVRELSILYRVFSASETTLSPLPLLEATYLDFAHWQRGWRKDAAYEKQLAYWEERLDGLTGHLDLPADRPRPARFSYRGERLNVRFEDRTRLETFSRERGVTPFMTLLTAWSTLLHRLSGQQDIAVGSPIANRNQAQAEPLVGFFVNTLVLRSDFADDPTFLELLDHSRETALGAYAHQDLPFEHLVEALQPERDPAYQPLFQTLLVLQNAPMQPVELDGIELKLREIDNRTAKFDLTLSLEQIDEALIGWAEYATDLYDAETIERFLASFESLLSHALDAPNERVSKLRMLRPAEEQQLIRQGRGRRLEGDPRTTLHDLVWTQVERTPDVIAVRAGQREMTYGELGGRAHQLARHLRDLGIGVEHAVAILSPRRVEMLIGLLATLEAGGHYVPIDPAYPAARRDFILADCAARVLLTEASVQPEALPDPTIQIVDLERWSSGPIENESAPLEVDVPARAAAYRIYTSGSTGRPKAVLIAHQSAVAFLRWAQQAFTAEELAVTLASTSFSFDVSVFELFAPLVVGGRVELVDDIFAVVEEEMHRAPTLIATVPSALRELLRRNALPASVQAVNLAGEALDGSLVAELHAVAPEVTVRNLYGPSEDTTYSTEFVVEPGDRSPAIGRPIAGGECLVLDLHLQPVPIGVVAELYLAGRGLARGYADRPALTADRFPPHPFAERPGERLYRTGDLARWRGDGQLEFLGRVDRQVKVRGFRIELGEIEEGLLALPEISEAAVLTREIQPGDPRLIAYVVQDAQTDSAILSSAEIGRRLRATLPSHMVPNLISVLPSLPKNANGKLDYRALEALELEPWIGEAADSVAPQTAVEKEVAAIWRELLAVDSIGIHDSFFETGGHSLLASQLLSRLEDVFTARLSLRQVFENPTIAAQSQLIGEAREPARPKTPIVPVSREQPLPLALTQERLWFMDQLQPDSAMFHVGQMLRFDGPLDTDRLRRAFERLVARHEILRTRFVLQEGRPQQVISQTVDFDWREIPLPTVAVDEQEARLQEIANALSREPFDLAEGPLLRLGLVGSEVDGFHLVIVLHHIICDDWSIGLMVRQVRDLYAAPEQESNSVGASPGETLQFADYAVWQRQHQAGPDFEQRLDFWREHLVGELPVLDLPTDFPRPAQQAFRGATRSFKLCAEQTAALRALARENRSTLFMSLLAGFSALLGRCAQQDDLVIGCPMANRQQRELEGMIGAFVNVLPLRIDLSGEPTYAELLARVRATALAGYDHQDVPFEQIVDAVAPERDFSRAAVRQVGLAFENHAIGTLPFAEDLLCETQSFDTGTARLDLTLFLWEDGETLGGLCEYNTDLFAASTIDRLLGFFGQILSDMTTDSARPILELPALVDHPAQPESALDETSVFAAKAGQGGSNLTESQLLFWFAHELNPDVQLYFDLAITTYDMAGEIDHPAFERAFQKLIDHSDALRSVFERRGGLPHRTVRPQVEAPVEWVDLSAEPDPEAAWQDWMHQRSRVRFDLGERIFDTAMVRLSSERHIWYWNVHHIIADAQSLVRIADILSKYYGLALEDRLETAEPLPSYEKYTEFERENRNSRRYQRARHYWQEKLAAPLVPSRFYGQSGGDLGSDVERLTVELDDAQSEALRRLAEELGLFSPAVLFATALMAWMWRLNGERTLRVGTPFANRQDAFLDVIGLQMNACPLQVHADPGDSFVDLARKVQRDTLETARFQFYPVPNPANDPVYDIYFNYQNVSFSEFCGLPVLFDLIHSGQSNDAFDLQVRDFTNSGRFTLDFDFNHDAFSPEERRRAQAYFLKLLKAIETDPAQPLDHIALLGEAEKRWLAQEVNDSVRIYPMGERLQELFSRQVERDPSALAVIDEQRSLNYGELERQSHRLAHYLRAAGVGPDVCVGIAMERSVAMVIAIYAVLKAGGAYVPFDPSYPVERLAFMFEDARARLLISQESLLSNLPENAEVFCIDRDEAQLEGLPETAPPVLGDDRNLAYMIYTSGSTGRPKGVLISHRAIVNRLHWMQETYSLESADRVLQKTPFSFDVSVWEFFWPLLQGASLVMARPEGHKDPSYLAEIIEEQGITTLHFVPSMLQLFVAQDGLSTACRSLKRVIASGEALPTSLVRRFGEALPGVELHNLYGPTEAAVDVTAWACEPQAEGVIPIGRPVANTHLHVFDVRGEPVPPGLPGELMIGGVQLARGYAYRPALTAERFVPNPGSLAFGNEHPSRPGARLYRTGDLARYRADGALEFLGRLDHQIKIRGVRIELGEIEATLTQHPDVSEALVIGWHDEADHLHLVAYVVARDAAPSASEWRAHVAASLPEAMVPVIWIPLEEMPLGVSGKVDRKALPKPDLGSQSVAAEKPFKAPSTPLEAFLAGIFAEVLGIDEISVDASFFDLGGNSLMATQVVALVQEMLPLELTLRNVFEAPTISAIALQIEEGRQLLGEEENQLIDEILDEFMLLSENEEGAEEEVLIY